jgi:hypothetical protein
MRQSTDRQAPRPLRSRAAALSKMVSRAWSLPRFARNPGNGQVDAPAKGFVVTHYSVQSPSALVISQTTGKEAAHA